MDRKQFIKTSGCGLGLAIIPGLIQGQSNARKEKGLNTSEPIIVKDEEGNVLNVIGDIQTHKLAGSDTDGQIVEWVNEVDPGVGIPPHIHKKEDEIFRVLKGQIELLVGDKTSLLKEGDIAFAPKNIVHSWRVVGTDKASMCTSAFPAGIEHMFTELGALPAGPPNFEKVAEICGRYGIRFV
jgi:quercetin dioxygenase-like cupin family protein